LASFGKQGVYDGFTRKIWPGLIALAAAATTAGAPAVAQQPQKPNILVIMADDIGYWNISAYNRGMMGIARQTSIASQTRARYSPTIMDSSPAPRAAPHSSLDKVHCGPDS